MDKILDKILDMEPNDIAERLDSLISQLSSLKSELIAGEPAFPDWAQELVDQRICLVCKRKIALVDTPNRGNHERHYRKVKRAIERGELTDAQAIEKGILAPAKLAGRPRKSLLEEVESSRVVDANVTDLEKQVSEKRKAKKTKGA